MKIGSLLRVAAIVSIGLAAILGWVVFSTFAQVDRATDKGTIADAIVQGTFDQSILTSDYLLHREERAKTLWSAKHASLTELVRQAEQEFKSPEERVILKTIREDHESSQAVYSRLITTSETQARESEDIANSQALEEGLTAQLLLKSQDMVSAASLLSERSRKEISSARKRAEVFVVVFLVIIGVIGIAMLIVLNRKVLRPITQLQRGTEIIGGGDLDYRTSITSRDEIGGLSRAFDQMTENLKTITASREELETEVAERKRAEEAVVDMASFAQMNPAPVLRLDNRGTILLVNPAASELYGETDLLGKSWYVLCPELEPMALEAMLRSEHTMRHESLAGERSLLFTYRAVPARGQVHVYGTDITERKKAEQTLLQQTEELAIAEERSRLAREIHDTLAQGFTAIIWQLNAAALPVAEGGSQAVESLERVRDLAREGLQQARRAVWDLRAGPLEGRKLSDALQLEMEKLLSPRKMHAPFVLKGEERVLQPGAEAALLRICQESLNNVLKHANATEVGVTLAFNDGEVRLLVQDNGIGFDPEAPTERSTDSGGFGLISMRERVRILGGELKVQSEPGRGTLVEATLSLS